MTRQGGYFASKMCFIASLMKHIIVLKVPRLLWTFNYRLQYIFDPARNFSAMIILFFAFSIIQIEIPQFRVEKMENVWQHFQYSSIRLQIYYGQINFINFKTASFRELLILPSMKRLNTNQDTKDLAVTLAGNCSAALCYFVAMENNTVHFIVDLSKVHGLKS